MAWRLKNMGITDVLPTDRNLRDTDDIKYFALGIGTGVIIGTVSTFIGNILTHRYITNRSQK